MAESDTVSTSSLSSASAEGGEILVQVESLNFTEEEDPELQEVAGRLNDALDLQPDVDMEIPDSNGAGQNLSPDSDSQCSSNPQDDEGRNDSDREDEIEVIGHDDKNSPSGAEKSGTKGTEKSDTKEAKTSSKSKDKDKKSVKIKPKDGSKKSKNPFKLLKRLTKFDKSSKKKDFSSEFSQIRIDKLPQIFVVKYLGCRTVKGFCGLHHVRKPVDEMVSSVQKSLEDKQHIELPLVYAIVSPKGIDIREHKLNKQKSGLPTGLVPIDFISYGVQDIRYWRVFTFIFVREMSSRTKVTVTECHAYLCDSSLSARKMALSLGASFKVYSRTLRTEGKEHNFQIELRPPDELADAYTKECEA